MSLAMKRAEREAFLADLHVGVLSVEDPGRAPLTIPIWYAYEPGGDVRIITGRGSRKFGLLEKAKRASLCAQTEAPPYKYVSIEGPIAIEPCDLERDERPMAHRYLGQDLGDGYIEATSDQRDGTVLIRIRPERWLTVDYTKQFAI